LIPKALLFLLPALLAAQTEFDAASVKPAAPNANGFFTQTSRTQIELRNCSLLQCIEAAWGLPDYAVSGPAWLNSVHFDVIAKLPAGASPKDSGPMLQTLLTERFELKTHTETSDVPGFALTVAKGGPKLQKSAPDQNGGSGYGPAMTQCRACDTAAFLTQLTRSLGRPIVDESSLTGVYDFNLRWTLDTPPTAPGQFPEPGASVFAAIQEQLGLKLEARKLPATVLVIDSANHVPSRN
jgi:uncharacterized protein (TIGR03435 family)